MLTKTDVGLANVDNTADTAKPVSSAQLTALNEKLSRTVANTTASASSVGLIVRGFTSQTADLTRWQEPTGGSIAKVTAAGQVQGTSLIALVPASPGTGTPYASWVGPESFPRYAVSESGVISWGTGAAADTNLYRSAADTLKTDDNLIVNGNVTGVGSVHTFLGGVTISKSAAAVYDLIIANADAAGRGINVTLGTATNILLNSKATADANNRFTLQADGKMLWGDGTAVYDTNFYRSAASTLKVDNNLIAAGTITSTGNFSTTGHFSAVRTAGSGSYAANITNADATGYGLKLTTGTVNMPALSTIVTGDAHNAGRFNIMPDGKMGWGTGAATIDTNLYRSAADTLKTDDAFQIGGNVGFYNTTPTAKPTVTGSRGGNAALASMLTALAGLGLLTDSTTA